MNDWRDHSAKQWDSLRTLAQQRGWPSLPGLTVTACAESVGMRWFHSRSSDTVSGFLQLDGAALTSYPAFGQVKVRQLIDIVSAGLGARWSSDRWVGALPGDESARSGPFEPATGDISSPSWHAATGLEKLGIPGDFPLALVRLPVRIQHFCEEHHLQTLGNLLDTWETLGERYFLNVPNLGRKSVGEVRKLWQAMCQANGPCLRKWLPMTLSGRGLSLSSGLEDAVRTLPQMHRSMMDRRLVHGLTLEETAARFNITRERTRQVEAGLLSKVEKLLDCFPHLRDKMLERWMERKSSLEILDVDVPAPDRELIETAVERIFRDRPEGAARELSLEARIEDWHKKLKHHPDLLVEGVDMQDFMEAEVPPEYRESLCLSLDGRGRIRLDHLSGRVVHTGPKLREVVKAILAREDDPIPLTWLHHLVSQTPTHTNVTRDQIYRYRLQWRSDDPEFPRNKVLWTL